MNSSLIDKILPIFHGASKKRQDLLCLDLSNRPELSDISVEVIDVCVQEIENLVFKSVSHAQDELYGQITKKEAKQRIKALSPAISDKSLDIIYERANYYARR